MANELLAADWSNGLAKQATPAFQEIGVTGLKRSGGYIQEEFLKVLVGHKGVRVFQEMSSNDPVVVAVLLAIEMLMRTVSWAVEPFSEAPDDQDRADFLSTCLFEDMSSSWEDTLVEILSFLTYGWSYHEIVYKRRGGDVRDPTQRSKYSDGRIGIRKLPIRAQDSLLRWEFNSDDGNVTAMVQAGAPDYVAHTIPLEKALLFRTKIFKGNPEGWSIIRGAYLPWFRKTHVENFEAIGIERGLAGIPVAWVPPAVVTGATPEDAANRDEWKRVVTNVRIDEQSGLVMPLAYDANGNKLYDFSLLSTENARGVNTDSVVHRYDTRIAMSVLAQFVMLGTGGGRSGRTGSYALSADQSELFTLALNAWVSSMAGVFNAYLVPRLWKLNGFPTERLAHLSPSRIRKVDLKELGTFIAELAGVGYPLIEDPAKIKWVDEQVGWPNTEPAELTPLPSGPPPPPAPPPAPGPPPPGPTQEPQP